MNFSEKQKIIDNSNKEKKYDTKSKPNDSYTTNITRQYLKEIASKKVLTSEEEKELIHRIKQGDVEARNILIEHNLRFVVPIAIKFANDNMPLLDLIQEGNLGLMKAIDKFDETKENKLCTYAVWWINQYILRAIDAKSRVVKLSLNVQTLLSKFYKIKYEYERNYGEQIPLPEIAELMNLPLEKVVELSQIRDDVTSIYQTIGGDDDNEIEIPLIADDDPMEEVANKELTELIKKLMIKASLTKTEITVLSLKYGLFGQNMHTFKEIGQKFNVSRQRVEQIHARALRKLFNFKETKELAKTYNFIK